MILVTGGSGFIGRYVVEDLIQAKKEVVVLTRSQKKYKPIGNERIIEGDLLEIDGLREKLRDYSIECCVHLAWEGIPDYSYEISERNLRSGLNVLQLCRDCEILNIVITGSCWEYDNPKGEILTDYPLGFFNAFQSAKNSLHMMAHVFSIEYGLHLNWLRLFYVYGPGQRKESLLPYIIECYKAGKQPHINGAYNENDFVYAGDVADAITMVSLAHNFPETLNVGSGQAVRVFDIVKMVACEYGLDKEIPEFHQNDPIKFYANKEEMLKSFGWSARTGIEDGIRLMITQK